RVLEFGDRTERGNCHFCPVFYVGLGWKWTRTLFCPVFERNSGWNLCPALICPDFTKISGWKWTRASFCPVLGRSFRKLREIPAGAYVSGSKKSAHTPGRRPAHHQTSRETTKRSRYSASFLHWKAISK